MVSEELPSFVSQSATDSVVASKKARAHAAVIERPARILLISVWFGLLAGLGEGSVGAMGKFVLHHYTHLGNDVFWMIPTADAIVFAVPGVICSIVIWRWPSSLNLRIAILLFALLACLSVLLRVTWLHGYASLILATGFAVQTSRLVVAHPQGFYTLAKRTLGLIVAIVVSLGIGVYGWRALAERHALANLTSTSSGAPNVLLIVMDTVGARHLSLYGYARPTTPQLERLAKAGVLFDHAISTAPWTLPSHASMFTGRYPHELSAQWQVPLDSTYPTLAERLSERGYLTAGFVGNTVYCSSESGLSRGFAHYEDFSLSPKQVLATSSLVAKLADRDEVRSAFFNEESLGRKSAERINNDLLRWISQRSPQRPFFAFVNYFDAHAPYSAAKPFDSLFGSKRSLENPLIKASEKWSESEVQAELDAYDNSIAYLDHQIGMLLDELKRRDLLENTMVIITSDHGEEFYEHAVMAHGWSIYLKSIHVPLLISFPSRVPTGKTVNETVTLRDLPATVIDLLNLNDKTRLPGSSLVRFWDNARDSASIVNSPVLSELGLQTTDVPARYPILKGSGNLYSLIVDRHQYIKSRDGREELYDFENDPMEKHDLAHSEADRPTLERLRKSLENLRPQKRSAN